MRTLLSLLRVPRRLRSRLTLGQGPRARLLRRFGWVVFGFMLLAGGILTLVSVLPNISIFQPRTASAILRSADGPDQYSWIGQAVHTFPANKHTIREDSVRVVVVDLERNRFSADVTGALPDRSYRFQSDGTVTLRNTLTRQNSGQPWELVNNVCAKEKPIAAESAAMPSGEELAAGNPHIIDRDARILSQKAWIISFTPSPRVVKELMLYSLLEGTTTTAERAWALSPSELKLINDNDYTVKTSVAWVTKNKPRTVAQISVELTLSNGRAWRLLAVIRPELAEPEPLKDLNLGLPTC